MDYFYITAPENHYDLADIFDGFYDTEKQSWRFHMEDKEDVLKFLSCSGDEETDEEDMTDYLNAHAEKRPKRSCSVHRARSSCIDKSSDSDSDVEVISTSSTFGGVEKVPVEQKLCDAAEKRQAAQQQKAKEIKKLIK